MTDYVFAYGSLLSPGSLALTLPTTRLTDIVGARLVDVGEHLLGDLIRPHARRHRRWRLTFPGAAVLGRALGQEAQIVDLLADLDRERADPAGAGVDEHALAGLDGGDLGQAVDAGARGAAAQDVVAGERHQHGVLDIVIERVAVADAFDGDPRDRGHHLHELGLRRAEAALHVFAEEFAECVGRKFGKGHHGIDLRDRVASLRPASISG